MQNQELTFTAPEYLLHPTARKRAYIVAAVSIVLAVYSFIRIDILTGILFCIIALAVIFFAGRPPQELRVKIDEKGIRINDILYPYSRLDSFWFTVDHGHHEVQEDGQLELHIETTSLLNRRLTIHLTHQNLVAVRTLLRQHLREDLSREETFVEKLARKLKI
jgi:hypothetical protein